MKKVLLLMILILIFGGCFGKKGSDNNDEGYSILDFDESKTWTYSEMVNMKKITAMESNMFKAEYKWTIEKDKIIMEMEAKGKYSSKSKTEWIFEDNLLKKVVNEEENMTITYENGKLKQKDIIDKEEEKIKREIFIYNGEVLERIDIYIYSEDKKEYEKKEYSLITYKDGKLIASEYYKLSYNNEFKYEWGEEFQYDGNKVKNKKMYFKSDKSEYMLSEYEYMDGKYYEKQYDVNQNGEKIFTEQIIYTF